jgi:DNA-binding LacI/PurR family transcriptional regulator
MRFKTLKPTSIDIAHRAQVSQATVSRALRDSPLVRPETRARIRQIAEELHYRTDHSAAGLRTRRSRTLALLLFEESPDQARINPFFLNMLGHITRAAARRGFDLLLSFQQQSDDWHTDYEVCNRADGLILLGYGDYTLSADRLRHLASSGAHFVIWGPVIEELPGNYLSCDNALGARLATRHLLEVGRRHIAFVGTAGEQFPEFRDRYGAVCETLRAAGIQPDPRLQADAQSDPAEGYAATARLLAADARFDGIVAASDMIAIGVIRALQQQGLRVPEDISVVGFDDIVTAAFYSPSLTTVRQDTALAGDRLVDHVIRLIDGEEVRSTLLPPALVVRESCGAAPVSRPRAASRSLPPPSDPRRAPTPTAGRRRTRDRP